ncbi:MAG TPA: hypothetical protein PLG56_04275 [Lacunisphaera sp.]|nr:hypothetical protein [Lacunisphaera sp.]
MNSDNDALKRVFSRPINWVLLVLPIAAFILLHIILQKLGYNPLPWLPLVAMAASFFYGYYVTEWLKKKK